MSVRLKAFLQILQRKATQFLVEKPATNGYRCPADDGPKVSFQGHPVLPIFSPPRYVDCCGPAGDSSTLGQSIDGSTFQDDVCGFRGRIRSEERRVGKGCVSTVQFCV